jgi:4-diphosphocytidyl-2-C-methyl-D-erythritol kinase
MNWNLYVAPPDAGEAFHPISSLMGMLPWLYDTLTLSVYPKTTTFKTQANTVSEGRHTLCITGEEVTPTLQETLLDNLIFKAIKTFELKSPLPDDYSYHWHLEKQLPSQAGLGGGSSDAATTLLLLNQLRKPLSKAYPFTPKRLCQLFADSLGSDVGFFIMNSPLALATGRGNTLRPYGQSLRIAPDIQVFIFRPRTMRVSTPWAYQQFRDTQKYYQRLPTWDFSDRYRLSWEWVKDHAYNSFQTMLSHEAPETQWFHGTLMEVFQGYEGFPLLCGSGACWAWISPESVETLLQSVATHESHLAQHFDTLWLPDGTRHTLGTYTLPSPVQYPQKVDPWLPQTPTFTLLTPYLPSADE